MCKPLRIHLIVVTLSLVLINATPAFAFDWSSLWATSEQRAAKQLEAQQYDKLIETAPNANWRGLGEFRKGDYAAAAKSFEQLRAQSTQAGQVTELERATYNQANAHIFEEKYQEAISLLDDVLESNPDHENAQHNRDIAEQLLKQQQQEQQQQQSGEQGEQNDDNQSEDKQDQQNQEDQQSQDGQDSQENQQDQQSDNTEQSKSQDSQQGEEQQQNDASPGQQADSQNSEHTSASAEEQAAQDAAAAAAMQAERERQAEAEQTENAAELAPTEPSEPLTEREQANEQWLRQIPDDPAGLLQRKIQNRHLTDFPKVNDSDQPW